MRRGNALGFIESVGLASAIAAADAALKAANVELIGRENTRGFGYITVKIVGEVGAVKAAIDAARAVSSKVARVWSVDVIPRPGEGLGPTMVWNKETVGAIASPPPDDPEGSSPGPSGPELAPSEPETPPAPDVQPEPSSLPEEAVISGNSHESAEKSLAQAPKREIVLLEDETKRKAAARRRKTQPEPQSQPQSPPQPRKGRRKKAG